MIGFSFFFKRTAAKPAEAAAAKPSPAVQPQRNEKPSRFTGGATERTQDLLGRMDGERVGFRKPVQG